MFVLFVTMIFVACIPGVIHKPAKSPYPVATSSQPPLFTTYSVWETSHLESECFLFQIKLSIKKCAENILISKKELNVGIKMAYTQRIWTMHYVFVFNVSIVGINAIKSQVLHSLHVLSHLLF